ERAARDPVRRGQVAAEQPAMRDEHDLLVLAEVALLHAARLEVGAELILDRLIQARRQRRVRWPGRCGLRAGDARHSAADRRRCEYKPPEQTLHSQKGTLVGSTKQEPDRRSEPRIRSGGAAAARRRRTGGAARWDK